MANKKYDVFLGHNSRDKKEVEELGTLLVQVCGLSVFLDKWCLEPGQPIVPELEKALNESASFAGFLGPSGFGPWQNHEVYTALNSYISGRAMRSVIPVCLPRAKKEVLTGFLANFLWVEFKESVREEDGLNRLYWGIIGVKPEGPPNGPWRYKIPPK